MKARLLLVLFLCALSVVVASANLDIIPSPGISKTWSIYQEYTIVDGTREYKTDLYGCTGRDTTIGNHVYRKVFLMNGVTPSIQMGYVLREDSVRIYAYDYTDQKEYVIMDFSLKTNDILTMKWIEETEMYKNPVFRVLAVGDTSISSKKFHYLKVYDTVHQVTDMWMTEVGSVSHGIAWHKYIERSLDTLETVLCVKGGKVYMNPKYETCYISKVENSYVSQKGKLKFIATPEIFYPQLDCCYEVLAAKLGESTYIIKYKTSISGAMDWIYDESSLLFQGMEYTAGDSVEVEGYVSTSYDLEGGLYSEIRLENIRKVGTTSAEKRPQAELIIFPNPATETITLTAMGCALQKVEILDVNGRVLYAAACNDTDAFRYNVSSLPSGIYFARVTTPCGVLTEKFSVR